MFTHETFTCEFSLDWPSSPFLSPIAHLSPFSFLYSLVPAQFTVVGNLKEFSNVILMFLQDFAFFTYFDTSRMLVTLTTHQKA